MNMHGYINHIICMPDDRLQENYSERMISYQVIKFILNAAVILVLL